MYTKRKVDITFDNLSALHTLYNLTHFLCLKNFFQLFLKNLFKKKSPKKCKVFRSESYLLYMERKGYRYDKPFHRNM